MSEFDQQAFLEFLAKEKKAGRDPIASMKRKEDIEYFKAHYDVRRSTPMRCPACQDGSLWISNEDSVDYICRKCHLHFKLECQTISNRELLFHLKELKDEKWRMKEVIQDLEKGLEV